MLNTGAQLISVFCEKGVLFFCKVNVEVEVQVQGRVENILCICSYPNLRKVQPNPFPVRAARGQGMTAVHPANEGLELRSPMHLRTKFGVKTKNGSYKTWQELAYHMHLSFEHASSCSQTPLKILKEKCFNYFVRKGRYASWKIISRRIICLGHLLLLTKTPERLFRSDQLLAFCWPGAPAFLFESNSASSWDLPVVRLKYRSWSSSVLRPRSICFSSDCTLQEALLSTLAHP